MTAATSPWPRPPRPAAHHARFHQQQRRCDPPRQSRGVRVTAEATPHHFTLTDESLRTFDANFKMNPPLRGREHVDAVIAGLIDARSTSSPAITPRMPKKRKCRNSTRPLRHRRLETSLGLVITKLIEPGHLDWPTAIRKMS